MSKGPSTLRLTVVGKVGPDRSINTTTVDPTRCGGCGETHYIFVNRNGTTLCLDCDARGLCAVRGHEMVETRHGEPVTAFLACRRCGKIGERL